MDEEARRRLASTFDLDARGYDEGRPPYPEPAWQLVLGHAALGPGSTVVEIGAGTGRATARLSASGASVIAIEPGASLAAVLRERFGDDGLDVRQCPFEEADLEPGSVDVVAAATSFHWLDPDVGIATVERILRPGGRVCLWWNVYRDPESPETDAVDRLVRSSQALPNTRGLDGILADLDLPARLRAAGFADVEHHVVRWEGRHREEELVALFRSFSDLRNRHHTERDLVLARLRLHAREMGGVVTRRYTTPVILGRKPT